MPLGIFLYEIDESFGPNLLAEYYIKEIGLTKEILKKLGDNHLKKSNLNYVTHTKDDLKYYSKEIKVDDKLSLYLGLITKSGEFIDSFIAVFDEIEAKIVKNFSKDKEKLKSLLREILHSRIELNEKLKEPKLIREKLNERIKDLLDEEKIQEARSLIDLGEIIPNEIAQSVNIAEESFKAQDYRNAKKHYSKAAELAEKIEELEIYKVLNEKAKTAENYPSYLRERDEAYKNIKYILGEIDSKKDGYYLQAIDIINKVIELSEKLDDDLIIADLNELINLCKNCSNLSENIRQNDEIIKDLLNKII